MYLFKVFCRELGRVRGRQSQRAPQRRVHSPNNPNNPSLLMFNPNRLTITVIYRSVYHVNELRRVIDINKVKNPNKSNNLLKNPKQGSEKITLTREGSENTVYTDPISPNKPEPAGSENKRMISKGLEHQNNSDNLNDSNNNPENPDDSDKYIKMLYKSLSQNNLFSNPNKNDPKGISMVYNNPVNPEDTMDENGIGLSRDRDEGSESPFAMSKHPVVVLIQGLSSPLPLKLLKGVFIAHDIHLKALTRSPETPGCLYLSYFPIPPHDDVERLMGLLTDTLKRGGEMFSSVVRSSVRDMERVLFQGLTVRVCRAY